MAIEKPTYEDDDSVDEQIRSAAADRAANRTEPTVTADSDENYGSEGRRTSMASMPAKKAPVVTKEELAASGLSLRDYLNKQQGLTRRGGGDSAPAKSTSSSASSDSSYRTEGGNKKPKGALGHGKYASEAGTYQSAYDKFKEENAKNPNGLFGSRSLAARMGYGTGMKKGGTVKMASGGSVSSASKRADGIATKGKTRGTMIMCGGGMAKR